MKPIVVLIDCIVSSKGVESTPFKYKNIALTIIGKIAAEKRVNAAEI